MKSSRYSLVYFDTSALLKKYVEERGSECLSRIYAEAKTAATSALTYAEVHSALSRLHRFQKLSKTNWIRLLDNFEKDWKKFYVIEFSKEVEQEIPNIFQKFPLRGIDGVHLASAASLAKHSLDFPFVCCDQRLNNAASDYGFKVINPEISLK